MVDFYGLEEHVVRFLRRPEQNVCTDGLLGGRPHPRVFGSFPRVLGKYVREEKALTLEDAIRKMTSKPAEVFGFERRGLLEARQLCGHCDLQPRDGSRQGNVRRSDSVPRRNRAGPHQWTHGFGFRTGWSRACRKSAAKIPKACGAPPICILKRILRGSETRFAIGDSLDDNRTMHVCSPRTPR